MNSEEMSGIASMPGSINSMLVDIHRMKRPPSLSESFAWTPQNVERAIAMRDSSLSLFLLDDKQTSPTESVGSVEVKAVAESESGAVAEAVAVAETAAKQPIGEDTYEFFVVNLILKFLFHIALISIFETVFFFVFVSSMEDSGILKTVAVLTDNIVHSCRNLTTLEIDIVDVLLEPFLNATVMAQQANQMLQQRTAYNTTLFRNAWIYVGGFSALFLVGVAYAKKRRIRIRWRTLVLENLGLVFLLALYEYMFFSTVIFPFLPISGQEVANNLVLELQSTCHLLNDTY